MPSAVPAPAPLQRPSPHPLPRQNGEPAPTSGKSSQGRRGCSSGSGAGSGGKGGGSGGSWSRKPKLIGADAWASDGPMATHPNTRNAALARMVSSRPVASPVALFARRKPLVLGFTMVRRLPVLSSSADEDERPAWQWSVIGVLFVFAIWAPLAIAGNWVTGRLVDHVLGGADAEELPRLLAEAPPSTRVVLWLASIAAPAAT